MPFNPTRRIPRPAFRTEAPFVTRQEVAYCAMVASVGAIFLALAWVNSLLHPASAVPAIAALGGF